MFLIFYPKKNRINMTITTLTFQVSKMDLTTFLAQLGSILRVKLENVFIRGKICFLIFGHFRPLHDVQAIARAHAITHAN